MKLPAICLSVAALGVVLAGCQSGTTNTEQASNTPAPASAEVSTGSKIPSETQAANPHSETPKETVDLKTLVGQQVPNFSFVLTTGDQVDRESLKGSVVLLDFWATWCVTCKQATPTMQKWHEQLGSQGLRVIGVNTFEDVDGSGDKNAKIMASQEASKKYAEDNKYTFDFAVFGDTVAENWQIGGVPAFVLIGRDGTLLAYETNARAETLKKLEAEIRKALGS